MSDYRRVTRLCPLDQVRPELRSALRDHARQLNLGQFEADIAVGCETRSERKGTGRLASVLVGDPDQVHYTAVVLTSQWLIWARSGDKSETIVASAPLKDLKLAIWPDLKREELVLELTGFVGSTRQRLKGRLIFSAEPAAQKFCEEVQAAVTTINPRPKTKRRSLFGINSGD